MERALSKLAGRWHNQHGSEVEISVSADGRVSGQFYKAGRGEPDKSFSVTGFATETLVAFTVDFSPGGALTSWTGHWTPDDEATIEATWNMTVALPKQSAPDSLWKGVWTGADTFRRGPAPSVKRPRIGGPSHPLPDWP